MQSRHAILLSILLTVVATGLTPAAAKDKKQQEAEALLAKARELSDIRCEGCPPFRLRTQVRFYKRDQSTTSMVIGSYVLLWQSKSRWREEVTFPDMHSLRWGLEGKVWREDSFEYPPLRVTQLDRLMSFPVRLMPIEEIKFKIFQKKDAGGSPPVCVEKQIRWGSLGLQCFDTTSGALVREDGLDGTYEYADHLAVGTKTFPRDLRALQEGNVAVQVHVEEIQAGVLLEDALFVPSPKAISGPTCESRDRIERAKHVQMVRRAKLVQMVRPQYPTAAKHAGIQGVVKGYGVVGVDGRLYALEVVKSVSPELDAAAIEAWSHWRYSPTVCSGAPVPVSTFLEMRFQLQ